MKKLNKRHFLLLEVMIALFLVAVCAIPVMSTYVALYKQQKSMNQTIELDHLAHLAHARIVEDLYFRGAKKEPLLELINRDVLLGDLDPHLIALSNYDFLYRIEINRPKTPKNQEDAKKFLMNLKIQAIRKDDPDKKVLREYDYLACIVRDSGQTQGQQTQTGQQAAQTQGQQPVGQTGQQGTLPNLQQGPPPTQINQALPGQNNVP